jgi:hypothetical protein
MLATQLVSELQQFEMIQQLMREPGLEGEEYWCNQNCPRFLRSKPEDEVASCDIL